MLPTLDNLNNAVWLYDFDCFRIHWANKAGIALWEADGLEELSARNFEPETSAAVRGALDLIKIDLANGKTLQRVWRLSPKGRAKKVFCRFSAFYLDTRLMMLCEGTPVSLMQEYAEINASTNLSTYMADGTFASANPSFSEETGHKIKHLKELISEGAQWSNLIQQVNHLGRFEDDVLINTLDGPLWFQALAIKSVDKHEQGTILLQLINIHSRKTRELALAEASVLDPLTGIYNRRGIMQQLTRLTEKAHSLVLFYIDLDGFKAINDTFGHSVGDTLLMAVAKRLTSTEFAEGLAGRIGGDEFVWANFQDQLPFTEQVLAARLVNSLSETYYTDDGHPLTVSASAGIAQFPQDAGTVEQLIVNADTAMYLAKQRGKRRFIHFEAGMETTLRRRSYLVQHLHKAIQHQELSVHYQSIIDTSGGGIVAYEALLRWNNRALGEILPREAIAVAEETGIINEIENWVFAQAIEDLPKLRAAANNQAKISLNLSGRHISDPLLLPFILQCLKKASLGPQDLWIELTESILLDNFDRAPNPIEEISHLGISMTIDDFGTGFSSLAHLHKLPVSAVKIDHSFISQLPSSNTTIHSIHTLIQSLGMHAIAEGIETEAQKHALMELGVHLQQGYFHALPRSIEDIVKDE